ncbi:MAG: hypothetical protein RIS35_2931, partial [Pseudomonadota bacterium]
MKRNARNDRARAHDAVDTKTPAPVAVDARADVSPARVLRQFRLVFSAVRSDFLQVERKAGISGAQLWALSVIDSSAAITVGRLAAAMDIHQTTASNLVRALEQQGLTTRTRGETDRRAVHLSLTDQGRQLLARAPRPLAGVLPEALARLDPETLARLDQDLGTL